MSRKEVLKLKITNVTTAVVEGNFDYTYIRIHTDEDLYGTGEAFFAPGLTATIRDFGAILVGENPLSVNACLVRLLALAGCFGGVRGAGLAHNAISGIEAALWDLTGKAAGLPIAALLGGIIDSRVPVYADLHAGSELVSLDSSMRYRTPHWKSPTGRTIVDKFYFEASEPEALDPTSWVDRAAAAVAAGFTTIKFDLDVFTEERRASDRGMAQRDLEALVTNVSALREAIGPDIKVAFDCHWRFDIPTSIRLAQAIEPYDPYWFEDPTQPEPEALRAIAERTSIPVATGENTYRLEGFEQLIATGAIGVLQPDMQKTGGLLEGHRIADYAARHQIPIAPHCIASPVGLMASAHVCAASTNVLSLEYHGSDVPFWSSLVQDGDVISRGFVEITDRPGLGVELDEEVARKYAKEGEPFFQSGPVR